MYYSSYIIFLIIIIIISYAPHIYQCACMPVQLLGPE